jgi:hypothetical protein
LSLKRALFGCILVAIGVCSVLLLPSPPARRAGSSLLAGASVDDGVRSILERSCADCHSDETRYPWYSYVPIVSRMIQTDVEKGREQLNLSRWSEYSRVRRQRALTGIANQVRDRAMPLPEYLALHPSARLSDDDVETVFQWAQKERLRLILEGGHKGP